MLKHWKPRLTLESMDQSHTSQTPTSGQPDPDPEELQLQVDFFRKLGYSSMEVRAALQKLGLSTDTNSMLGELVRSRAGTAASTFNPEGDETMAGHPGLDMAPSWAQGPLQDTPPPSPLDKRRDADSELKPIVIDGSNVAMSHGNQEVFSCRGIELAVNYFLDRDHTTIIVIVPSWRKEQPRSDAPITDQHILMELERKRILVFTPSRRIGRKRVVCYDDRFIVKVAYESDGVIVSNDTYRDLQGERQEWKRCIEERLLMYSFVNDKFMPPDDPLGRHGPSLDNFLRKKPLPAEQKRQLCPYDKKCTYGIKCKFYHPERTNQPYRSLADELRENAKLPAVKDKRNPMMSPMWPQSDPGPFLNSYPQSLGHELEHRLTLEHRSSPHNAQMSENMLLYWDGPHPSANQSHGSVPIGQSQMGWPGMCSPSTSDLPYASISHEPLDSGLGSYESQYSDASQGHSKSVRSRQHQHQQHGFPSGSSRYPAMLPDRQDQGSRQPCRCCSHSSPLTDPQQHRSNPNLESHSHCQPRYDTPSHTMFPPHMQPHYSLPSSFQQGGSHHPHQQQMYWSDPFQGMTQGRTSCSLPSPVHSPHSHPHLCSSSYGDQQHSWERPQTAAFDSEREQVRKKLQAIFNPQQVDTVMGMFPHLKDAQKLAAEIINLKSQGRVF